MKKLRVLALVMAFVMAMTMFVGCGKEKEEEKKKEADTIKIGFIGPLTGETAQYGENVRNGAKMYIDEVNAAGGINGKQIEFIDYDDKSEPTDAASAYSRLVDQDGVCAIIGPVTTNCANAVAELAAEDGIPVITSSGTGDSLTEVGKTFFRTCYKDSFQGTKIAQYMSEILGYKKVAVLYNSAADYSVGLANAFKAECEKVGITIVANESYAGGDTDYKSQLTNIAAAAPEAIFFPFYYSECYMAAQQAKEANVNVPFFGGDGFAGLCEIESVDPKVVEGFIFSDHFFVEDKNTAAKS
ncbi:MAG: ABC transporter substrate-binding protein, partial [Oscillospiraceae bacterium]